MKKKFPPKTIERPFEVWVKRGVLFSKDLREKISSFDKNCFIITDDQVLGLYGERLKKHLDAKIAVFPHGEKNKTRETKAEIEDFLLQEGGGKDCLIIALGGGVVTDLAGFVAASFCRGVSLISVPTTLMGMVDAALGGKNGVNHPLGKNLIGSILEPDITVIDPSLLSTLSIKEWKSGLVEMLKHGCILDRSYLEDLLLLMDSLPSPQEDFLEKMIQRSVEIKLSVVQKDLRESGLRRILNFGHTLGHAFEKEANFSLSHGFCVAVGMIFAAYLSVEFAGLPTEDLDYLKKVLLKLYPEIKVPKSSLFESLWEIMQKDKKAKNSEPRFVLLRALGEVADFSSTYCRAIGKEDLKKVRELWESDDLCLHCRS